MARPLLPLLCGAVALLLPCAAAAAAAQCSRPQEVPNAHVEVGNGTQLHARLRYACKPGYKRKAGTSSLTQCVLPPGAARPAWTQPTLQCIRDPALPPPPPSPEPSAPGRPAATATTTALAPGSPASGAASLPGSAGRAPEGAPPPPTHHPAGSPRGLLALAGLPGLLVAVALAAGCCWRMKARQGRREAAAEGVEMLPAGGTAAG